MKYCAGCGQQLTDDAGFCVNCGAEQPPAATVAANEATSPAPPTTTAPTDDKGGFLWGLLGFLVPVAGLILYLIWREEKPKNAKAAGIGAIVGAIVSAVVVIFYILLAAIMVAIGL